MPLIGMNCWSITTVASLALAGHGPVSRNQTRFSRLVRAAECWERSLQTHMTSTDPEHLAGRT